MLIKMRASAAMGHTNAVLSYIEKSGCTARAVDLPYGRYIAGPGVGREAIAELEGAAGVEWVREGAGPALAALETNPEGTVVPLGDSLVGGETIAVMAGPCSVESGDQVLTCARFVAAYGATVLRGGAFKPRTSPYSFQGLGTEALKWLREAGRAVRLPVVSEILDPGDVEMSAGYVDCLQVGARSMQNFPLLRAAGRSGRPVLLKRGNSASIEELLLAAEYILLEGNPNVILCERGIRTFETATRNTLDLNAVPVLKGRTHLPVIVDPSHGTGRREAVAAMAKAAVAAGADGLMVEVHPDPQRALSDGDQSLTPAGFRQLMEAVRKIARAVGRKAPGEDASPFEKARRNSAARRGVGWGAAG